jgi:hypothetical protein
MKLKADYIRANCCQPTEVDSIIGYYSYDNLIKVHKTECENLRKADQTRLVSLQWRDILGGKSFKPDDDYNLLDEVDFRVLNHHSNYGVDYSLKVARILHLEKQSVFDSHDKLRDMGLLERVEPKIIRYRKGIVDNKWIKHRNHTYYNLTKKGEKYLQYFLDNE